MKLNLSQLGSVGGENSHCDLLQHSTQNILPVWWVKNLLRNNGLMKRQSFVHFKRDSLLSSVLEGKVLAGVLTEFL